MSYKNFPMVSNVMFGRGSFNQLSEVIAPKRLSMKAPFIYIVDDVFKSNSWITSRIPLSYDDRIIYESANEEPKTSQVDKLAEDIILNCKERPSGIIGIGGGSMLDLAKAVAIMLTNKGETKDYQGWDLVKNPGIYHVGIPTISGTGAEVSRTTVLTGPTKKLGINSDFTPFDQVILDPELTVGLPASITAATGMDALSHNLEAYCSPFYHPMADGIAMEGMRLVKDYLPRAVANGNDLDARTQMLVASLMGATAFQKGLGGMHAIAHSLGALYGAHHGLLNAILMPYIVKANRGIITAQIERLGNYLRLDDPTFNGFMNWILAMRRQLEIPHTLSTIDIDESQAERIGKMSVVDAAAAGNPIAFSAERYAEIFVDAVNGSL